LYVSHYLVLEHTPMCRGYALVLLVSSLLCWRWLQAWHSGRLSHWLQVGLLAGLGVWAHYFMALLPAVMAFAMLWRDGLRQPWRIPLMFTNFGSVMTWGIWILTLFLPLCFLYFFF
jgi:hypothetical protein